MGFEEKVRVLTEGAKYDVSCSSSGGKTSAKAGYVGNTATGGICHSFTSDGRCISLLKILLSNHCIYDCLYCANRRSNDIPRARLTPDELCRLTINFYRRNYIEGLFLSCAVEASPDRTMEKLIETVELLRTKYKFRGYIHLKAIPGADKSLIDRAAAFADRMSLNIELPSEGSLKLLAPQKKKDAILLPMRQLAETYIHDQLEKPRAKKIPAGQTTQMIIGASPDTDARILRLSQGLYDNFRLKRVYYSSYVPVNTDNSLLPMVPSDLRREHRLYEADFLIRLYGFKAEELLPADTNLSLDIDVKSDWALNNYGLFPLEINKASYEMLLRVPGIGVRNAYRIAEARRHGKITFESLKKMRVVLKRAKYFITADGKFYGDNENPERIRNILKGHNLLKPSVKSTQLSFFDTLPSYITGEL
ncbi:MAG: putative DNA modification/repair radical SAM protein [Clostridiales bacterium]|nr:putative DNA modification/repair radical SAM protein [Clostridiales bacterium]